MPLLHLLVLSSGIILLLHLWLWPVVAVAQKHFWSAAKAMPEVDTKHLFLQSLPLCSSTACTTLIPNKTQAHNHLAEARACPFAPGAWPKWPLGGSCLQPKLSKVRWPPHQHCRYRKRHPRLELESEEVRRKRQLPTLQKSCSSVLTSVCASCAFGRQCSSVVAVIIL